MRKVFAIAQLLMNILVASDFGLNMSNTIANGMNVPFLPRWHYPAFKQIQETIEAALRRASRHRDSCVSQSLSYVGDSCL